jgi:hypothetical protein
LTISGHFDIIGDGWWSVALEVNIFSVSTGKDGVMHSETVNTRPIKENSGSVQRDGIRENPVGGVACSFLQ